MKNRLISLMLAALMLVSLFPLSASAADIVSSGTCGENLTWTFDSDGLLTISGTGAMRDYGSGSSPFYKNTSIQSVIIEPGVTSIGTAAFRQCSNLTNISIPESVFSIGEFAFFYCSSLTSIAIPDGVKTISEDAFSGCGALESITLPDGLTSIEDSAFYDCSSLKSITIPSSVTNIGSGALNGCSSLQEIVVSQENENYKSVDGVLFSKDCSFLMQYPGGRRGAYTIPDSATSIGEYAFHSSKSLTSLRIPNSVTSIGEGAFEYCSSLKSLTIPDGVTSIGTYTFFKCSSLVRITIPNSVTSIGESAFSNCSSLTSVTIPEGVTSIGSYMFSGCSRLTSIKISDSLRRVEEYAFNVCSSLKDVFYSGTSQQWNSTYIVSTGNYTLLSATVHISGDIHIHQLSAVSEDPATCETDGAEAYWMCSECGSLFSDAEGNNEIAAPVEIPPLGHALVEIPETPPTCSSDGFEAYWKCSNCGMFFSDAQARNEIEAPVKIPALEHVLVAVPEVPAACAADGAEAYWKCSACGRMFSDMEGMNEIAAPVVIPATGHTGDWTVISPATDTEEGIEQRICTVCGEIESRTIPATGLVSSGTCGDNLIWRLYNTGLLTISGTGAMMDYSEYNSPFYRISNSIRSVVIYPGVTSIGSYAFQSCSDMTSLTIPGSVTSIANNLFGDYYNCKVEELWYSGTRAQWEAISISSSHILWKVGWHLSDEGVDIGRCGDNLIWTMDSDGLVTISGTGEMRNYSHGAMSGPLTPFYYNEAVRSLVIEPGVSSIGSLAFSGCTNLESLTIPNGVTSIGSSAFRSCSSLTSVEIPESVTSIENSTFYGCSSLMSITIPEGVTSIGGSAFSGCSSLTSITIPDGVESIGDYACNGCSSLMSITIPSTVTSVGTYAFQDCTNLTEVFYGGDAATWKRTVDASNILLLEAPHIHFNTASPDGHFYSITVPATCEADGYTARTCDCGYEYDRVVTESALGHDWTPWATLLEPTATTKGIAVRICANDPKHVEFKALPTVAGDPSNPFTDVPEGKFYHDPVLWAISQNPQITTGVTKTTFEPDRVCTRAHVVTFLWRANGCPNPSNLNSSFKDVKDTSKYYYKAVLWAAEQGITTGYSDGTFRPDDECSRGQVVTFLWRAKGQPTPTGMSNPFTDVPSGKYYTTAVLWALQNNITKGRTATTFGPDDACTRGHVVTFLYRAYA